MPQTNGPPIRMIFRVWALLVFGLLGTSVHAIEYREVRWGFNGAVSRHEFNLCSVDLMNASKEPFQGNIELWPVGVVFNSIPLIEPDVYIGPGETRTIQFTPYIGSDAPTWEVRWGNRDGQNFQLPSSTRTATRPVAVQFLNPQSVSRPIRGIEAFSEFDFPIGAPGTELLGTVVLDHVPRWDEVRRRAFRDWLGRGGQLYLLNNRDGKPLEFPSLLEELNEQADRFQVGQGLVIRHNSIEDVGEIQDLAREVSESAITPQELESTQYNNYYTNPMIQAAGQLVQNLQARVRPNHNWPLIFLVAVIYLLALFPGIWLFSRKRGDFRITYLAILLTVGTVSFLYAEIGKRGYNESTGLQQMMIVEPLGNQRLFVRNFANLFVTDGGEYPIEAGGESGVFTLNSSGDDAARFSGTASIVGRPQARLLADIPPFSSCSYLSHTVVPSKADYSMNVGRCEFRDTQLTVEARLGAAFRSDTKLYFVTDVGTGMALNRQDDKWVNTVQPQQVSVLFPSTYINPWNRRNTGEVDQNMQACLVQVATGTSVLTNAYSPQMSTTGASTPTPTPRKGFLIAMIPAPPELLGEQLSPEGMAMFITRTVVDAPATLPDVPALPATPPTTP